MPFYYQPIAELDRESQKVLQKQKKTTKSAIPILCRITHNFFYVKTFFNNELFDYLQELCFVLLK